MHMNRRQFLATSIAGAAATLVANSPLAAQIAPVSTDPFQTVTLGKTGIKVSLIGAGTGMRGGNRQSNMTRLGKEKFEALLHYELQKGITFYDCADLYGTHPYIASAFKAIPRDKYVVGSKIWVMGGGIPERERPDANVVVERFRKELNSDYIDLLQIHCMGDPNWTDQQKKQMDIMEDLKAKRLIKAHGVSIHCRPNNLAALEACATDPWVDVVHVRINAFGDSMDDKDPKRVAPVIKKIHDAGKGVIGMKLVGEGRYRNDPAKRDESIRYVLGLGTVDMMIVGFEKTEEVDDFAIRTKTALETKAKAAL